MSNSLPPALIQQPGAVAGLPLVPADPPGAEEGGVNLREIWRAVRRRKRLALVTAATVTLLAAVQAVHKRIYSPVYQGGFQLLISDPIGGSGGSSTDAGAGGDQGDSFRALALNRTSTDLPTLFEVLRSPLLLEPVARRHGLSAGDLAGNIGISTGGSDRSRAEGVLNVSLSAREPRQGQRLLNDLSQTYLQYSLAQRQERLTAGLKFLDRQAPALVERANSLANQLAAFRRTHNLLEPMAEGTAIKERSSEAELKLADLTTERARLIAARQGVLNGTLSARSFQEAIGGGGGSGGGASGASGGSGGGLSLTASSQGLLQQLGKLEDQMADTRSRYSDSSSMLRGLEARRQALLPLLRRNQLEAIDAALASNADRSQEARSQKAQLDRRFQRQPALIKQYDELQQKLEVALANLSGLRAAKEGFSLELAQRTVPWRLIANPGMGTTPILPSLPRDLAKGLALGLAAGVGAALLRDRLDHVFHTPTDVRETLQLPLLGHVPHVSFFKGVRENKRFLIEELDRTTKPLTPEAADSPEAAASDTANPDGANRDGATGTSADPTDLQLTGYQRFYYQEAFRNLFTSIRFLKTDAPLRSIAITSSLPTEGKSLVNVLLAKTLSEMGQRVLLIDADLRKPQIHHRLGLNNLTGLTNVLSEDDLHWRQALQRVAGYDNWSVLTSGRIPPDPARLLSSQRMQQLVNTLADSGEFDLILYDTPPVLGLADAALVAQHLDGLVLLVSLNRVDRGLPKEAVARITSSGAALLGVVTNAVTPERLMRGGAYGYGYGKYGYGKYSYGRYGYGYGKYGYNVGYSSYDPRNSYAYYQPDNDEENATTPAEPTPGLQRRLRNLSQRALRWIDQ